MPAEQIQSGPHRHYEDPGERVDRIPRKGRSAPYGPRLRDLKDTTIKSVARSVFAALCEFKNENKDMWPRQVSRDRDGWLAWPSIPLLSEVTGFSERAVQNGLKELEAARAIECVHRSKGGNPRDNEPRTRPRKEDLMTANCYLLTPHLVHGYGSNKASVTPHDVHGSMPETPHLVHGLSAVTVHHVPSNRAPGAPKVFIERTNDDGASSRIRKTIRTFFPNAVDSQGLADRILEAARKVSPQVSEEQICSAMRKIHFSGQTSPGFWLSAVPSFLAEDQRQEVDEPVGIPAGAIE